MLGGEIPSYMSLRKVYVFKTILTRKNAHRFPTAYTSVKKCGMLYERLSRCVNGIRRRYEE
jgi:hypothetical protein